jgi:hypothetical protein
MLKICDASAEQMMSAAMFAFAMRRENQRTLLRGADAMRADHLVAKMKSDDWISSQ